MTGQHLHGALSDGVILVSQYAGSDTSKALVALLDMLIAVYRYELETVSPAGLMGLQAQVQQCRKLHDVLTGVPHADPRI